MQQFRCTDNNSSSTETCPRLVNLRSLKRKTEICYTVLKDNVTTLTLGTGKPSTIFRRGVLSKRTKTCEVDYWSTLLLLEQSQIQFKTRHYLINLGLGAKE